MSNGNEHHFATNRANWDDRAGVHASRSSGYKTQTYIDDRALLSNVVKFDLPRLGDISGKSIVHLQCHIGTDSLSLARLGGIVTGLDFSQESISAAKALVGETGDKVEFVTGNVYDAASLLTPGSFDIVFTGIGALCWLPDIEGWASTVSSLLCPGGFLFIREGHPVLWAVDETLPHGPTLRLPYFNESQPLEWDDEATYVATDTKLTATKTFLWNHGIGEILTALLKQGLVLETFVEHDSVPWEALPGMMVKRDLDEWGLKERSGCMPLSYTLIARKPM